MARQVIMAVMFAIAACCSGQEPKAEVAAAVKVKVTLADGSQLQGTLRTSSLALVTAFGKQEIPFAQITALDFAQDRVKVRFHNQDILSGYFEGATFDLQTVFDSVRLNFAQVKAIRFLSERGTAHGNEPGLLLHALLDSDNEDLGIFDARMEIKNAQVIEGPSGGNALLLGSPDATISIDLPFSPYLMPEGTIEFWAKLPQPHQPFGGSGGQPLFFNIECPGTDYTAHFIFGFVGNDGCGGAGLIGRLHGLGFTATHSFGAVSTVAKTRLLGDTPDGWHHYAFIWKRDGANFPEAMGTTLLLVTNNKVVASCDKLMPLPFPDVTRDPDTNTRLSIHDSLSDCTRPVAMSDLKIWNYAKLPDELWRLE